MKEVHSRGRLASEFTAPQRKVTKKSAALYTAQQRSHMIALGTELKWKLRVHASSLLEIRLSLLMAFFLVIVVVVGRIGTLVWQSLYRR